MSIDRLFYYWSLSYYTIPAATLMALTGGIIFLVKKRTKTSTYLFVYYFAAYVILSLIYSVSVLFSTKSLHHIVVRIERFTDFSFTLFEFLIFYIFFQETLRTNIHKKLLVIVAFVFFIVGVSLLIYLAFLFEASQLWPVHFLYNLQAVSLLIPCAFYYTEIFKRKPDLHLAQEPSFWVVTGLSFVLICTFPLSLCINYLYQTNKIIYSNFYSIFYIFYFLLFLMIIQGHLCKQTRR
jgi:hypothetical protein